MKPAHEILADVALGLLLVTCPACIAALGCAVLNAAEYRDDTVVGTATAGLLAGVVFNAAGVLLAALVRWLSADAEGLLPLGLGLCLSWVFGAYFGSLMAPSLGVDAIRGLLASVVGFAISYAIVTVAGALVYMSVRKASTQEADALDKC